MREKDTTITAEWFDRILTELKVDKKHEYIFMDDGGIGHAVIDMLRVKGWEIRRVRNEARPIQPLHYGNRGAELWYAVKRFCEERFMRLDNASDILREQLISRQYKKSNTGGRIFLESKVDAKSEGRPSPDRADAYILSFTGLTVEDFLKPEVVEEKPYHPLAKVFSDTETLEQYMYDKEFNGESLEESSTKPGARLFGSLNRAMDLPKVKSSKYAHN